MTLPSLHPRAVVAVLACAAVAACGTRDAADPLAPTGPTGRVRFVNLITDTTRGRVNATLEGLPFGVNLTYGGSTPAALPAPSTAPYAAVYAGSRTLVLRRTADTSVVVATFPFTVGAGEDRTVYAVGGTGGGAITAFATLDTNTAPTATQARLRLVNLSPTAGPVDLFVTAVGADLATATPVAANVAYQRASTYLTLAPGTFQVRAVPAGTPAASRAANVPVNLASIALAGGTARTILVTDAARGGTPLGTVVIVDR